METSPPMWQAAMEIVQYVNRVKPRNKDEYLNLADLEKDDFEGNIYIHMWVGSPDTTTILLKAGQPDMCM